jgi:hypothetical protein
VFRDSDSTSRLLSAVVAGSAVRRAFGSPSRVAAAVRPASPELERLRRELGETASESAAYAFLEHVEPESLAAAHRAAFGDQAGPEAARGALRSAWDAYRHDRCRGMN